MHAQFPFPQSNALRTATWMHTFNCEIPGGFEKYVGAIGNKHAPASMRRGLPKQINKSPAYLPSWLSTASFAIFSIIA